MRFCKTLITTFTLTTLIAGAVDAGIQKRFAFQRNEAGTPRIIGGTDAAPGAWPWTVALIQSRISDNFQGQFCGGTLISPEWVVTAAHCTDGKSAGDIDVLAGVTDLKNDTGERVAVKRIVQHPEFNRRNLVNDISLLQLSQPVSPTPAPTDIGPETHVGELATIIGWGDTDPTFRNDFPFILQQAEIPIISNALCESVYGSSITEGSLCAGYAEGGKDTCQGDSGGPLVLPTDTGWELAGITSFGNGCAQPGFYGVYTRVATYETYIDDSVNFDYVACADVNGDTVIDAADVAQHKADGRTELTTWISSCYRTGNTCGDINQDSQVTRADLFLKWLEIRNEHNDWLAVCWTPEAP